MQAKKLGYKGEELAAKYLTSRGFEIIASNFTVHGGEIDLIAKKNGILVFVEVKTRTSDAFGSGEESFTSSKKRALQLAINRYLQKTSEDVDYRVDLMEIDIDKNTGNAKKINHFEDIEL